MVKGLLLVGLLASFSIMAQSNDAVKNLINKNALALKTVQKNLVAKNQIDLEKDAFKSCLTFQISAINAFKTNTKISNSLAITAREKCLVLLKKYSSGSTDYFEIETNNNQNNQSITEPNKYVSKSDNEKINSFNLNDLNALNSYNLTIQ